MEPQEIFDLLKTEYGDSVIELKTDVPIDAFILVATDRLVNICKFLRDDSRMQFDYLCCLSGVDYNNGTLGSVYHLSSMTHGHKIVLKVLMPKDNPTVPSVVSIWASANWHERESYDLLGIIYTGHPDLRRILLPDDWEGYPLRKDYKTPEFYNGMKVPY